MPRSPSSHIKCENCGRRVERAEFCGKCGHELGTVKRRKAFMLRAEGFVVGVIVGGVLALLMVLFFGVSTPVSKQGEKKRFDGQAAIYLHGPGKSAIIGIAADIITYDLCEENNELGWYESDIMLCSTSLKRAVRLGHRTSPGTGRFHPIFYYNIYDGSSSKTGSSKSVYLELPCASGKDSAGKTGDKHRYELSLDAEGVVRISIDGQDVSDCVPVEKRWVGFTEGYAALVHSVSVKGMVMKSEFSAVKAKLDGAWRDFEDKVGVVKPVNVDFEEAEGGRYLLSGKP